MAKKPTPVQEKKEKDVITINPNTLKVRDMRGINLSGCGFFRNKIKYTDKYACRKSKHQRNVLAD